MLADKTPYMRAGKSAFALCLMLLAVALSGCNHSIDDMVDSYNTQFTVGYASVSDSYSPTTALKPNDEGWDESMLLYDEYFMYDDGMLILAAPDNCPSATWRFFDPDDEYSLVTVTLRTGTDSNGNITYFKGAIYAGDTLTMYVPESGLTGPKTYQLQLSVISEGGNTYTDSCGIVVYQRYDR